MYASPSDRRQGFGILQDDWAYCMQPWLHIISPIIIHITSYYRRHTRTIIHYTHTPRRNKRKQTKPRPSPHSQRSTQHHPSHHSPSTQLLTASRQLAQHTFTSLPSPPPPPIPPPHCTLANPKLAVAHRPTRTKHRPPVWHTPPRFAPRTIWQPRLRPLPPERPGG